MGVVRNAGYQLTNLINDPAHRSLRDDLEAELQQWLTHLDDPFPTAEGVLELLGQTQAFRERHEHFRGGGNW